MSEFFFSARWQIDWTSVLRFSATAGVGASSLMSVPKLVPAFGPLKSIL